MNITTKFLILITCFATLPAHGMESEALKTARQDRARALATLAMQNTKQTNLENSERELDTLEREQQKKRITKLRNVTIAASAGFGMLMGLTSGYILTRYQFSEKSTDRFAILTTGSSILLPAFVGGEFWSRARESRSLNVNPADSVIYAVCTSGLSLISGLLLGKILF